jgi:SpoVK/Ycf46/Vps4 family AAA+-type ATPase
MRNMSAAPIDARVTQYHRKAALLSRVTVPAPQEKAAALAALPRWRSGQMRQQLEAEWADAEQRFATEAQRLVDVFHRATDDMESALCEIGVLGRFSLKGKVDDESGRLVRARAALSEVVSALRERDLGGAGRAMLDADRELWSFGGALVIALADELRTAAYGRDLHTELVANQDARRRARARADEVRERTGGPDGLEAAVEAYTLMADGLRLVARVLGNQSERSVTAAPMSRVSDDNQLRLVPPHELERLDDVGGLDEVKQRLRRSFDAQLAGGQDAARYGVQQTNVLLYGPPGTGKTLLARAVAGEYGLRYMRVSPASVASPYAHETVRNLARVFDLARRSTPCLLFLDEIDSLAAARTGTPSAEQRELVTQLLTLLDEHRAVPKLAIMGATNAIELLDGALREGRFDVKVPVPMPDAPAREHILRIHLQRRDDAVDWPGIDVAEIVRRTPGWSGAALAALVNVAVQRALAAATRIGQMHLVDALGEREARDRISLEAPVHWDDVVLRADLAERLHEMLEIFQHPEMATALGIAAPAGVLLYGPPGTGKTTIAKAMATEVRASFYEMSAAELLSKWVGESEERVAKLFATARENRPSIIFIDEIDGLLRRRSASSVAPWEERLVSQFLRELDGLASQVGVFLVGATNRIDIIDEAIRERRLVPLEVGLPDTAGRRALLDGLFRSVRLALDVDLDAVAAATAGMSGADLKSLRDAVGMKALSLALRRGARIEDVEVAADSFTACLEERRRPPAVQQPEEVVS